VTGSSPGRRSIPVERTELVSRDMELIAKLINRLYSEHRARFRCDDPGQVDGTVRAATANDLGAGLVRYGGFEYGAEVSTRGVPFAVVLQGHGVVTGAREQLHFGRGDVVMPPMDLPYQVTTHDIAYALLEIQWPAVAALAEEQAGLAAADLRFEAMAPVSAARAAMWSGTAAYICRQLVESGATEISSLLAHEMARLAGAALLEAFPNTTMTLPYLPAAGWVPPAAVRRAAAFIEAHADHPVALAEIAAAAGVTGRALQYAFRRYYDMTPTGYLRRVRLERAHRELRDADPAGSVTVAAVARSWGWANPSQFTAVYRRQFGQRPGQTLRT
jgi:AraC-like DNA-binding protein